MAVSMDDIKCRKSKQYPGDPYHVITVAGTPVENIQKHTRRGQTWYESDTFSTSYSTITEAKEKTFERCNAGYYGPALSTDATEEKEHETMIIEPGSELDKRAEANETAVDAMDENDVRALAQALGHQITDRNGNARDTQVLRNALKQTHPDDFDAAKGAIQPQREAEPEQAPETVTVQSRHSTFNAYLPPALDCFPGGIENARKAARTQARLGREPVTAWTLPDGPTRYFYGDAEYVLDSWDVVTGKLTLRRGERRGYVGEESAAGLLQMTYTDGRPVYVKAYNPGLASPIPSERAEDALPGNALAVLQKQFPGHEFMVARA